MLVHVSCVQRLVHVSVDECVSLFQTTIPLLTATVSRGVRPVPPAPQWLWDGSAVHVSWLWPVVDKPAASPVVSEWLRLRDRNSAQLFHVFTFTTEQRLFSLSACQGAQCAV